MTATLTPAERQRRRTSLSARLANVSGPTWASAIAVAAGLARLPFIGQPLGSDEGGFLLVAAQWRPGTSLYGNYWVDRPPLLMDFFAVADHFGGMLALRLLGTVLVMAAVLLAGRVGGLVAPARPRRAAVLTACTAAIFLVSPLFGATEVNGELIAVPLVLLGVVLVLAAARADDARVRAASLFAAGAAGAAAALVKQNELDVLVILAVGAVTLLRSQGVSSPWRDLGTGAAGATSLTVAVLGHALSRGTGPADLWTAVVTFRLDAAEVIHASASSATGDRLHHVLLAFGVSGAPLILALLAGHLRLAPPRGEPDLRWPTLALLGWEAVSVLGGGSYWMHYLVSLVPGLVLVVAVVAASPAAQRRRWPGSASLSLKLALVLGYAAVVTAVSIVHLIAQPGDRSEAELPVIDYLRSHAGADDTAVIAYGHPNILRAAGLSSPYTELWSLPVKVRDANLHGLAAVLAGDSRPEWVITGIDRLDSWGIDARAGEAQLAFHYREVADIDGHHIYRALTGDDR